MSDPIVLIGWFLVALLLTGWLAVKIIYWCWVWVVRFNLWRLKRRVRPLGDPELNEIVQKLPKAFKDSLKEDD